MAPRNLALLGGLSFLSGHNNFPIFSFTGPKFSILMSPIETSISIKKQKRETVDEVFNYLQLPEHLIPDVDLMICESLNNPPDNSTIIITGKTHQDIIDYSLKIKNGCNILGVCGIIANELKSPINDLNVFNTLKQDQLIDLCEKIKSTFQL